MYHFMIDVVFFRSMIFNLSRNFPFRRAAGMKKKIVRVGFILVRRKKVISYFWLLARGTGRALE